MSFEWTLPQIVDINKYTLSDDDIQIPIHHV